MPRALGAARGLRIGVCGRCSSVAPITCSPRVTLRSSPEEVDADHYQHHQRRDQQWQVGSSSRVGGSQQLFIRFQGYAVHATW